MRDFLEQLAEDNDWKFEYGRKDYQNLVDDMSADTISLFVDPIVIDSVFTSFGNEIKTYSGKMMLLLSSDIDETYQEKYDSYIKPLMDDALQILKDAFRCSEFEIKKFSSMEVINMDDVNLDGLLITYSVKSID